MRIFFFSFRSFVSYSFLCGETKIAADRGKTLKWLIEGNSLKSFLWLTFRFERVRTPFQRFSFWLLAIQREQHIHILNSYLQRFAPSEIDLINVSAKIITLNRHCQGLWVVSESLKTWAWTSRDEIWAVLIYYPLFSQGSLLGLHREQRKEPKIAKCRRIGWKVSAKLGSLSGLVRKIPCSAIILYSEFWSPFNSHCSYFLFPVRKGGMKFHRIILA